jgi:hypothetical protein
LWAVGSLIGTTLDVDLVSLRSLGVVRILVAMMEPKNLDKMNELQGYACLGVSVTVKLKGYDFFFRREQPDFVPDKGFTPFFWKCKGDDAGNDGPGQDNDDGAPTRDVPSTSTSMDVDKPQSGQSAPLSKSVPIGPGDGVVAPCVFAVTPINPNPKTPRGQEIVKEIRARSSGLFSSAGASSVSPLGAAVPIQLEDEKVGLRSPSPARASPSSGTHSLTAARTAPSARSRSPPAIPRSGPGASPAAGALTHGLPRCRPRPQPASAWSGRPGLAGPPASPHAGFDRRG